MLALELRFLTGRYHATPWDQHVNEGGVEWPPCPFRLLRALVATRHLKARHEVDETDLARLMETLASALPSYRLPISTSAHTRHYMPIGQIKDGTERTTKVFDTFMHLDSESAVEVMWPTLTLTEQQEQTLALLLDKLGYIGRAESWVAARLLANTSSNSAVMDRANAVPLEPGRDLSDDEELTRVLCPMTASEIMAWRTRVFEQDLERRLSDKRRTAQAKGKDPDAQKLTKADKDKIDAALPRTVMDVLQVDTGELRRQGWSRIPGTRWVEYARPRASHQRYSTAFARKGSREYPKVARFAVASQVPPRLTRAVFLAERVRLALLSRSDAAVVFAGKDEQQNPLRGNRHAYILPEANGAHGRITHVTIFSPMGFDEVARRALEGLRNVRGRDGYDTQLVLLGIGQLEDFAGTNVDAGQCPLLVESDTWVSRTPFVPTRHAKVNRRGVPRVDASGLQIGSPEHDLRRLLREAGLEPASVESIDSTNLSGKRTSWLAFDTVRHRGAGARGANRGFGFRVVFSAPVRGPIAVGYGAHFGLGAFVPA